MSWHVIAGVAQVALIVAFVLTQVRARAPFGEVAVSVVAMGLLAAGTFIGAGWALVAAGVFYAVWLLDQLFGWFAPARAARQRSRVRATMSVRPTRARGLEHALLGAMAVAVLALTWFAVGAAGLAPLA